MTLSTSESINLDKRYGANNYHPLPVVIAKAKGVKVEDPEGNEYFDFLSAYSAVNQGHRNDKIINALKNQLERCTLTSRAFHNDVMGDFLKKICEFSGYEKALPMNTGAEAVETAIKLARRWAVEKKGIENGKQEIICVNQNFHGRTISIISMSIDEDARKNYGPYTPGFINVDYNNKKAIEEAITENTCAIIIEPIQGEAGVFVPYDGYLKDIRELCDKYNFLFIADEIQTGLCRTGKRFAVDYENVKPDIMTLGKALGGGVVPVSVILSSKDVMDVFTPGSHGSTFGGYPIASAVAKASIEVLEEEKLDERAYDLGNKFRDRLNKIKSDNIIEVRGKGLLNAVVFKEGIDGYDICLKMKERGVLAKQTHGNIIRFAPPLVISEEELNQALDIIEEVIQSILKNKK